MEDDNNLLKAAIPHLLERRQSLKAQIDDIDRICAVVGRNGIPKRAGRQRKAKGENRATLKAWFSEHPAQSIGQTDIARETSMTASSARAALEKLISDDTLERDGSLWRLK